MRCWSRKTLKPRSADLECLSTLYVRVEQLSSPAQSQSSRLPTSGLSSQIRTQKPTK